MSLTLISVLTGITALMLGAITQATRAIFQTGKLIQIVEDMRDDLIEMRSAIKTIDERTYQSAIRNSQGRR